MIDKKITITIVIITVLLLLIIYYKYSTVSSQTDSNEIKKSLDNIVTASLPVQQASDKTAIENQVTTSVNNVVNQYNNLITGLTAVSNKYTSNVLANGVKQAKIDITNSVKPTLLSLTLPVNDGTITEIVTKSTCTGTLVYGLNDDGFFVGINDTTARKWGCFVPTNCLNKVASICTPSSTSCKPSTYVDPLPYIASTCTANSTACKPYTYVDPLPYIASTCTANSTTCKPANYINPLSCTRKNEVFTDYTLPNNLNIRSEVDTFFTKSEVPMTIQYGGSVKSITVTASSTGVNTNFQLQIYSANALALVIGAPNYMFFPTSNTPTTYIFAAGSGLPANFVLGVGFKIGARGVLHAFTLNNVSVTIAYND